jgi:hypothetical protein
MQIHSFGEETFGWKTLAPHYAFILYAVCKKRLKKSIVIAMNDGKLSEQL